MSNSIRLSKKHGVNPTICKCFFCGESKGIALLGQIGDLRKGEDIEAPIECVMDYEPCEKCQENMDKGVTLIEVTDIQPIDNRPAMTAKGGLKVYPLGSYCVVTPEAVKRVFNADMKAGQKVFVDSEVMRTVTGDSQCQ